MEGRVDTRLLHRFMECGEDDFGVIQLANPSNDPRDVAMFNKRFHTQRQMFFFPDDGKEHVIVLAETGVNQTHEQWWNDFISAAERAGNEFPDFGDVPRGFIFDYFVYWYQGHTFHAVDGEVACLGTLRMARSLKWPDQVPVFNGMHIGEPGSPWRPVKQLGVVRKLADNIYTIEDSNRTQPHGTTQGQGDS